MKRKKHLKTVNNLMEQEENEQQQQGAPEGVVPAASPLVVGELVVRAAHRFESGNSAMTGSHSATVLKLEMAGGRQLFGLFIDGSPIPMISLEDPMADGSGIGPILKNVLSVAKVGVEIDTMESATYNSSIREAIAAMLASAIAQPDQREDQSSGEGGPDA